MRSKQRLDTAAELVVITARSLDILRPFFARKRQHRGEIISAPDAPSVSPSPGIVF